MDERVRVIDTFGPPLPAAISRGSLQVRRADPAGTRLLLLWVVMSCDKEAEIAVRGAAESVALSVHQWAEPPCNPGTGLTVVELAVRKPVDVDGLDASLSQIDRDRP
jgi:hypothetical protein